MNEDARPLDERGAGEVGPLLDEATVARLRAKETETNAKAEAAAEARTEKYRAAKSVKVDLRLEELRAIPKNNRTPDEQREFARLEARRHRANAKKGQGLSNVATAEEFWSANRLTADQRKIKAWKEQEERVLDKIFWMNEGWSCPPQDADFVSLEEGLAALEHFVAEHGLVHDDPHSYKHSLLQEFRPAWGLWADKDYHEPISGWVKGFGKYPELFRAV